jgi:Family of unknown function (DUF6193)
VTDQQYSYYEVLYQDVAERGGLANVLTGLAAAGGMVIGEIHAGGSTGQTAATMAFGDRSQLTVVLIVDRRMFSVRIVGDGRDWASGGTTSLQEVVEVAAAWYSGMRLAELHGRFPFMEIDALAEAYEAGNPVPALWDSHLADPELTAIRPLLAAARQHPDLGLLYLGVSHLTLARFRIDDRDRELGAVDVQLLGDGRYQVSSSWVVEQQVVETIDEAVSAAAEHLLASG